MLGRERGQRLRWLPRRARAGTVRELGMGREQIHEALRIASVVHAVAVTSRGRGDGGRAR